MKGLYLDVEDVAAAAARVERILGLPPGVEIVDVGPGRVVALNVQREDWPAGPTWRDARGRWAAAAGWLVFDGKLGHLRGLAEAYFSAADEGREPAAVWERLDGGAFVVLFGDGERLELLTDPFGLHPHFVQRVPRGLRIAPSPHFLRGAEPQDRRLARILRAQGHLFGNLTAYRSIERVPPGAFTGISGTRCAFDYSRRGAPLEDALALVGCGLRPFEGRRKVLPLSGGLDSRLLLASSRYDLGFTFGPEQTGDRPVARRFAHDFDAYLEFSLLDLDYPRDLLEAARILFDGLCTEPFVELLPVYQRVRQASGPGAVIVDGYCGDVLQRGTYLTARGVAGSLARLFPGLGLRSLAPAALLRRRYRRLSEEDFGLLLETYEETTRSIDLPLPWKLMLFELLHGRGARFTLNGGTLMASSFFTVVQAFFLPPVFACFVHQDPYDTLSHRTVSRLWGSCVPARYAAERTYSGFHPTWNAHLSRTVMLGTKALGKIGLLQRPRGYEVELPHIRWR